MKDNEKQKLKNTKGITLIALVITIIVLLLLAGISISMIAGENGILHKAAEAKVKSNESTLKEEIDLAVLAAKTAGLGTLTQENLEEELGKISGATVTDNGDGTYLVFRGNLAYKVNMEENITSANGIALSERQVKLLAGGTKTLTVNYFGSASGEIIWESDNDNVTVENGEVKAVSDATGTAQITATCGSYTTICTVTIVQKIIGISTETIEVGKGKTKKIEVTTNPTENVEGITYTYQVTQGENYAEVDSQGNVKGKAGGSAIVTITGITESGEEFNKICEVKITSGTLDDIGFTWSDLSIASKKISKGSATTITNGYEVNINGNKEIKIGDTKTITIGTDIYLAQVIGFNHDKLSTQDLDYGDYAGISFQLKNCMTETHNMNNNAMHNASWQNSEMRVYLQGEVYDVIEDELKAIIKEIEKVTATDIGATTVTTTKDTLWLLSEKEVFGVRKSSNLTEFNDMENKQYAYYANSKNEKRKSNSAGNTHWWLRSPGPYGGQYCAVTPYGSIFDSSKDQRTSVYAYSQHAVAFGFAI